MKYTHNGGVAQGLSKTSIIGLAVTFALTLVLSVFSIVRATAYAPSTNDTNRTNGWAHVNAVPAVGEVELELVQPRSSVVSCFEYRTDGDTSQVISEEHPLEAALVVDESVGLQLYPFDCLTTIGTEMLTLEANEYVEVRMLFGGEGDERFDWTRFDVLQKELMYQVNGGGQIVDEAGDKKKDWHKVSFGTGVEVYNTGIEGDLIVQFHNVSEDDVDKRTFRATEFTNFNYFAGTGNCNAAMNLTANGTLDGVEGYTLIMRAGDNEDTVRFELAGPSSYDTLTDWGSESACQGTARAVQDRGNINIFAY